MQAEGGKILKYEVKAWRPDVLLDILYANFKGSKADLITGEVAQLQTDLIAAIKSSFVNGRLANQDSIINRWLFDARLGDPKWGGITKQDLIDKFSDKLRKDVDMAKHLVNEVGDEVLFDNLDQAEWGGAEYDVFINSISQLLDHMIEINGRLVPSA